MAANHVTLIGNLVDDPGAAVHPVGCGHGEGSLCGQPSLAGQERCLAGGHQLLRGTLWRDAAENAAESLTKGARVIVTGRLEQRSWETQEGEKRSMVEVAIDEIGPRCVGRQPR